MAQGKKNYNSNNQNYNNNNNQAKVKHSGAKNTTYTPVSGPNQGVEQHLTTGWRLSKGELISIKCVTTSKSNLSDKGWFGSVACTFTNTKTGVQSFHWGTMQKNGGKVVIDGMAFYHSKYSSNV